MKKLTGVFTLSPLLLLAACGGGGAGTVVDDGAITPKYSAYPASMYYTTAAGGNDLEFSGWVVQGKERENLKVNIGDNIDSLIVNGKEYDLGKQDHVKTLSFSRFGYFENGQDNLNFVQGVGVDEMPSAGKVHYTGTAVQTVNGYDRPFDMNSRFDVDFGAHKLTGKIEGHGMSIDLSAEIRGSIFEGKSSYKNEDGKVFGSFFGQDAAEMAGVYHISHTANGAFGAAKNK